MNLALEKHFIKLINYKKGKLSIKSFQNISFYAFNTIFQFLIDLLKALLHLIHMVISIFSPSIHQKPEINSMSVPSTPMPAKL